MVNNAFLSICHQRMAKLPRPRFCGTCSVKSHFNAFLNAARPGRPTAKRSDSGPPAGPRYESATIRPGGSEFRGPGELLASFELDFTGPVIEMRSPVRSMLR